MHTEVRSVVAVATAVSQDLIYAVLEGPRRLLTSFHLLVPPWQGACALVAGVSQNLLSCSSQTEVVVTAPTPLLLTMSLVYLCFLLCSRLLGSRDPAEQALN